MEHMHTCGQCVRGEFKEPSSPHMFRAERRARGMHTLPILTKGPFHNAREVARFVDTLNPSTVVDIYHKCNRFFVKFHANAEWKPIRKTKTGD